ncbi:MAG: DUF4105 domain-containing protein, partial [Sphaerochaetaceae bacterium]|nr:DUF4105 domain-containing protein [Sphaerochaetaceae bacterium]
MAIVEQKSYRKAILIIFIYIISFFEVFSLSVETSLSTNAFDSIPMLNSYYNEDTMVSGSDEYWDSYVIKLVTIGRGKPLFSWFGHSGIEIDYPTGESVFFDYGTFSFSQDHFIRNFILGRLWFSCSGTYTEYEMNSLKKEGREVSYIVLPLGPKEKYALINFLFKNYEEEHRVYLYHHYEDNCATRLRDIINYTTKGDFESWAKAINGHTYRSLSGEKMSNSPFVLWVLDFIQSGNIDNDNSLWEDCFLPENLNDILIAYYESKGIELNYGLLFSATGSLSKDLWKINRNLFGLCFGLLLGSI